jgi:GNAT superfamily N-acetyltransferase
MVPIKEVETMHIRHVDRTELASLISGSRRPWLAAVSDRLLELPDHPRNRILIADDGGQTRAILGLELEWTAGGRLKIATISVLEVDPEGEDRGIGSRLVRFAEDIAHIKGCDHLRLAPGLERWGGGLCRPTLGCDNPERNLSGGFSPRDRRSCA